MIRRHTWQGTGGNTQRLLERGTFTFTPMFKLTMEGSKRPPVQISDDGRRFRRITYVPWSEKMR